MTGGWSAYGQQKNSGALLSSLAHWLIHTPHKTYDESHQSNLQQKNISLNIECIVYDCYFNNIKLSLLRIRV